MLEADDAVEANELFQRNGWTDGLPVMPPTEDAVARFLEAAMLSAADVIGTEPVRRRRITAEKVAIAAV
ncbi:MAG: thioredoxin, partial [Betaproteobacteria bacterium]|nr:thioredoxin [Betaproteobacteria bacterium]